MRARERAATRRRAGKQAAEQRANRQRQFEDVANLVGEIPNDVTDMVPALEEWMEARRERADAKGENDEKLDEVEGALDELKDTLETAACDGMTQLRNLMEAVGLKPTGRASWLA